MLVTARHPDAGPRNIGVFGRDETQAANELAILDLLLSPKQEDFAREAGHGSSRHSSAANDGGG